MIFNMISTAARPVRLALFLPFLVLGAAAFATAQTDTGADLYEEACSACHGIDGTGNPQTTVGFDTPLPDFSDCRFASREADGDWLGIVTEGGPVRAFDRMMPAFGDALSEEEILQILGHVRSFCEDSAWPRGDLNLPLALVTEKAFPEDESLVRVTTAVEEMGSVMTTFVHEKRFGSRNQIEIAVPFSAQERVSGNWHGGVGDMAFAFKRALFHSVDSGTILSAGGEIGFPTGDADRGFGKGFMVYEPFVLFGQILPSDSFVQFQGGVEMPADRDSADEAFWRTAVGRTWTQGFGRSWTPMVEVVGVHELETGGETLWDVVPQVQVSLPTRQHILFNVGVRTPVNERAGRSSEVMVYLLWDWFDGGLFEGW